MIVFLSFAPIEFMGGAERMIYKLATFIKKHEDVVVINADPTIANLYGSVVLQRKFTERITATERKNNLNKIKIHVRDLLPYSKGWKVIHNYLLEARLIYIKYEILELFFLFYFGGLNIRKKTIASLHSPLLYDKPTKLFDRIHTLVYSSRFNQLMLKHMQKIHVLNIRDEAFLQEMYGLNNVVRVPNSLPFKKSDESKSHIRNRKKLFILFVGELSIRKGADILINLIKNSSDDYIFSVAGDGPLREELISECKDKTNWKYYGYLNQSELKNVYSQNDILFAPSRAEGLSLVMLEALSHGLQLVGYDTILSDFLDLAKVPSKHNIVKEYEIIFENILIEKKKNEYSTTKQKIKKYFVENFSDIKVLPIIQKKIFALNI